MLGYRFGSATELCELKDPQKIIEENGKTAAAILRETASLMEHTDLVAIAPSPQNAAPPVTIDNVRVSKSRGLKSHGYTPPSAGASLRDEGSQGAAPK